MKYEYMIVTFDSSWHYEIERALNKHGAEGWQVVAVDFAGGRAVLMREKQPTLVIG